MLRFLNASNKNSLNKIEKILNLRKKKQNYQSKNVEKIILNVKKNGDKALIKYEKKFSNIKSNSKNIKFLGPEIDKISNSVEKGLKKSIELAYNRIKKFHSKQKSLSFKLQG